MSIEYKLSFANFYLHDNGILEMLINDGVEIDVSEVEETTDLILSISPPPRLLLANRKNKYSYTFAAILKAIKIKYFDAVAVLFVDRSDRYFSKSLWPKFYKISLFNNRDEAISWLISKSQKVK